MRVTLSRLFFLATLCTSALAQSSSSASAVSAPSSSSSSTSANSTAASNATTSANSTLSLLTTTITSLVSSGTASPSPTTLVLTLTVNTTAYSNGTTTNTTSGTTNGTLTNGTVSNTTVAWNETDGWVPFNIVIDPAYGTLGALLILSGIPVAVLGGKNRWVQPDIQQPSPNPPSTTLRGLYLLACIISAFFGAGIGVFLYKFAKHWVCAAGGFTFAWFLMAVRSGGLIQNTLGRWGLFGGMSVAWFVAGLPKKANPWMILVSTAWIGATAFTLGVDCYTRAGLKEFYIYNLGFYDLFPSLNGLKYPLTQTMQIELGILAAVVVIGGAIQFRVLNILQKRLKQIQEEEEFRLEAGEVAKAAERFKNVGTDLAEWEEKHGKGPNNSGASSTGYSTGRTMVAADRSSVVLPQLDFGENDRKRASSQLSLLGADRRGQYESVALNSPTLDITPPAGSGNRSPRESIRSPVDAASISSRTGTDAELESKLRLLDEVKKARTEVRSSLDKLRGTPSVLSLGGNESRAATPATLGGFDERHSRNLSGASGQILQYPEKPQITTPSEWDTYVQDRKIISPPSGRSPGVPTSASMMRDQQSRPQSQYAMYDSMSQSTEQYHRRGSVMTLDRKPRTNSMLEPRVSDFGSAETLRGGETHPTREDLRRVESAHGLSRPSTFHELSRPPIITGSAARPRDIKTSPNDSSRMRHRTMTYDELSERHRKRISQLQDPVTSKMREEVEIAAARERWEKQKRIEREEMRRREQEKAARLREREREGADVEGMRRVKERGEVIRSTDEWRRSVHSGLSGMAQAPNGRAEGTTGKPKASQRASRQFPS